MSCSLIENVLSKIVSCIDTVEGCRVATHCLYPSLEPVYVHVVKVGSGFTVHDGNGAFHSAWLHGRDETLISRSLDAECRRFHTTRTGRSLAVDVESADWLPSAILAVSNASSLAAHAAVAKIAAATEKVLIDRIEITLSAVYGQSHVAREVEVRGRSGGYRNFDVMVLRDRSYELFVNGVAPHHSSVSAKYVAFADVDSPIERKLAVFDRQLDASDAALLQEVSRVVQFSALPGVAPSLSAPVDPRY